MKIHSYASLYNVGHAAVRELTQHVLIMEEKVDGSQFSFGLFDGELSARSKNVELHIDLTNGTCNNAMFNAAIRSIIERRALLHPGYIYRGEYLSKPKHNALAYDRVPAGNIIIFDIQREDGTFLSPDEKALEATAIGLEAVKVFMVGKVNEGHIREALQHQSALGAQKIEGVVLKPVAYDIYGTDKKVLMAKFVSEDFKEVQRGDWKKSNPNVGDIIAVLGEQFKTPARFNKGVQHLREAGKLTDSPKDIGPLLGEVTADIKRECEDEIKAALFKWAWPRIARVATAGLPDWYKQQLLALQFDSALAAMPQSDGVIEVTA
jgi:hypothetical protein